MYNNNYGYGLNGVANSLNQQANVQQQLQVLGQQFLATQEGQEALTDFNNKLNEWISSLNNMGK